MDRSRRKVIRVGNSQDAKNSEFVARGIPSPPSGGAPSFSVSPLADNSLQAFAESDAGGIQSPGAAVRLSEFIGKKNRSRRRRRPGAQKPKEMIKPEESVGDGDLEGVAAGFESLSVENSRSSKSSDPPEHRSEEMPQEQGGGDSTPGDSVVGKLLQQLEDLMEPASVPEDELSRNKQEQDDEILALEAIYEGAFRAVSDTCFMIEVPMELAAETIEVALEQPSASSPSTSSSRPLYTFVLEFLPPIHFGFSFPRTYPSRTPPVFVLECQWLPPDQLLLLTDHLSKVWEEAKGEVIVYPWSEFLHSQALSFLGASQRLVLEHSTRYHLDHPKLICGSTSQQHTAAFLLGYNEEMRKKTFFSSLHMCNICFTEYTGKDFIRLSCQHLFCRTCMEQHTALHVAEGTVGRLICPSCPEPISPYLLKKLLGEAEFERWERLLLQKTLDSMRDIVYCPRCETACIEDLSDFHAQCHKCFYSFCGVCRENWHAGRRCLSAEHRLILLEEQGRSGGIRTEEQRRKEKNLVDELKSLEVVQNKAKFCPICNMAFFKDGGCNKITCGSCGGYFCYVCGKAITGYEHFRDQKCELVNEEDMPEDYALWQVVQRQEQINEQRAEAERLVAEFPERIRNCPGCGTRNLKINNNNHLCCTACQSHYCGVCLKIVRKASEHFAPNKCKQHSADAPKKIEEKKKQHTHFFSSE